MQLSQDQKDVLEKLTQWSTAKHKSPFITVGGYAGTGKTTVIAHLRTKLHKINPKITVAFCSYTGKAAQVLKSTLHESKSVYKGDIIGTIHSLIYTPIVNDKEEITGWRLKDIDELGYKLIIVDEASMIDERIWNDLCSFDIPIIAVGDHGQLPPVNGRFNLMLKPQLLLEQIHRQAEGNPIIEISRLAREQGFIPEGKYGPKVMKIINRDEDSQEIVNENLINYNNDTLVLCGYNITRVKLNSFIRQNLEFYSTQPQVQDRVICLRNNHEKQIFNGMIGTIYSIDNYDELLYQAEIKFDLDKSIYKGLIIKEQFNESQGLNFTRKRLLTLNCDLFDFGYALTVHKAQGSQANKVILFEQRFSKMNDEDWRRWLYTGITRAQNELLVIG
ncbi:AAA family ATPase [Candidatus Dojkabacteria bacterium]|nr:AAA family ATPase [Candidatus Dojkabacteria bacterium]